MCFQSWKAKCLATSEKNVHINIESNSRKKWDGASNCAWMSTGQQGWKWRLTEQWAVEQPLYCGSRNWRLTWEEGRVKGSSHCYARCVCIVTVKSRCLFSVPCQLLALQGGRKRLRQPFESRVSFFFLWNIWSQSGRQARSLISVRTAASWHTANICCPKSLNGSLLYNNFCI